MHTASSANLTCRDNSSASEYTATVLIPNSWHALITLNAISPLLAMRIFLYIKFYDWEITKRTWLYSTGLPLSVFISVITPSYSDSISFIIFIASIMQSV